MSRCRAIFLSSVPGKLDARQSRNHGHIQLRQVLKDQLDDAQWSSEDRVVAQFSSVGSLGASADSWLKPDLLTTLGTSRRHPVSPENRLQFSIIFPSEENVRQCLEGYMGGGSIPYMQATAAKQPYLREYLHQWSARRSGRHRASPHIKTYARYSPDFSKCRWFVLSSSNLSKAAWGALNKQGGTFTRNYEVGVLLVEPKTNIGGAPSMDRPHVPVPYDLPTVPYAQNDREWLKDGRHPVSDVFGFVL